MDNNKLTLEDFASLFGTDAWDISEECRTLIAKHNFSYRTLDRNESDETMRAIRGKIDSGELPIAGAHEHGYWEKTWKNIFGNFTGAAHDVTELVPNYLRHARIARLYTTYVAPEDGEFWVHWFAIFRQWLFGKYLKDAEHIHEFGCGTGHNLALLSRLFPEKKLYGYDWVPSSADIIATLAEKHGYRLEGRVFDMFSPDEAVHLPPGSAVLTVHALEQLGPDFEKFLNFILEKSPEICVHIEPICELYDPENPVDALAIAFHTKRNYLQGYLTRLRQLEEEGKIEILKTHRVPFGSLYHDSYSYIIWRPKK